MADEDPFKNTRQLRKAYTSRSAEEIREYYDDWAGDYETHMENVGNPNVVGIDNSPKMLAVAANKKTYRDLRQLTLGEPLDFANDHFAAVVGAGVFTDGHAPLSGLDELIRVTRAGGHIVFTVSRTYLEGSFDKTGKALEAAGRWQCVDVSERYNSTPLEGELMARVQAYRVV